MLLYEYTTVLVYYYTTVHFSTGANGAVVVRGEVRIGGQEHFYLEPMTTLAVPQVSRCATNYTTMLLLTLLLYHATTLQRYYATTLPPFPTLPQSPLPRLRTTAGFPSSPPRKASTRHRSSSAAYSASPPPR